MIGAVALVSRTFRAIAEIELGVGQLSFAANATTMAGLVSTRAFVACRGLEHLAAPVPGGARDVPAEENKKIADRSDDLKAPRPAPRHELVGVYKPGPESQPFDPHGKNEK
jgi:hypothetical protein